MSVSPFLSEWDYISQHSLKQVYPHERVLAMVQENTHTHTHTCSFLPFPNSMWRQRSEGIWRHMIQETKLSSSVTDLTELWCKWEIDFYFIQLLRSWSWSSPFGIHLSHFASSCLESLLILVNTPVPLTITLMAWTQPPGLSPLKTSYFACVTLKVVSTQWSSSSEVGAWPGQNKQDHHLFLQMLWQ